MKETEDEEKGKEGKLVNCECLSVTSVLSLIYCKLMMLHLSVNVARLLGFHSSQGLGIERAGC